MSSYSAYLAQIPDGLEKNMLYMWVEIRFNNMRGKDHLEDTGVDGKIILRWIFSKLDVGVWTGST